MIHLNAHSVPWLQQRGEARDGSLVQAPPGGASKFECFPFCKKKNLPVTLLLWSHLRVVQCFGLSRVLADIGLVSAPRKRSDSSDMCVVSVTLLDWLALVLFACRQTTLPWS